MARDSEAPARSEFLLPNDAYAAAIARRRLAQLADDLNPQLHGRVALLLTEIVTNAVKHAAPDSENEIHVVISRTTCEVKGAVTNHGPGFEWDGRGDLRLRAVGGWGLVLVDALADDWGTHTDATTTTVWFRLCTTPAGGQQLP